MGSGTLENKKIAAAENPVQASSPPVHPLKPVIRHLLKNAAMCAIIFLLAHLLGLREYTGFVWNRLFRNIQKSPRRNLFHALSGLCVPDAGTPYRGRVAGNCCAGE